ncbi:MAG TPA: hypothetical protein VLC55_01315, partial [Burkholderiales bacterium]|nr:hypothetical protein [Burkholderiales bacterium]
MADKLKRLLETTDVHALFPSLVWEFQLKDPARDAIDATLGRLLARLRAPLPPLARGAGWQSGYGLHQDAELRDLIEVVEPAARSVLAFLKVSAGEIEFTGCWA